jgi:hypothetical protein
MTNNHHPQVTTQIIARRFLNYADIRCAISTATAVAAGSQAGGKPLGLENVRVSDLFSDDAE